MRSPTRPSFRTRVHRRWLSAMGIHGWMMDTFKTRLATLAERLIQELSTGDLDDAAQGSLNGQDREQGRPPGDLHAQIATLRESLRALDDVADYVTVEELDDEMYTLWKELERKMQKHRQSQARYELSDMFRI